MDISPSSSDSVLCVRSESLMSASRASPLPCPGIAGLRRSAALLLACSFMLCGVLDRLSVSGVAAFPEREADNIRYCTRGSKSP